MNLTIEEWIATIILDATFFWKFDFLFVVNRPKGGLGLLIAEYALRIISVIRLLSILIRHFVSTQANAILLLVCY
jgi:hypothetical protein